MTWGWIRKKVPGNLLAILRGIGDNIDLLRLRVGQDKTGFVLAESGKPFVPWGVNWIGPCNELVEELGPFLKGEAATPPAPPQR